MRKRLRVVMLVMMLLPQLILAEQSSVQPDAPKTITINGVEFVLIPQGWFWYTVGNAVLHRSKPKGKSEYRTVRVWIDGFYMARYEATARDLVRYLNSGAVPAELLERYVTAWSRGGGNEVLDGTGCTVTIDDSGKFITKLSPGNYPATFLSWELADAFTRWMGFRLPGEAEWQRAARGDDQRTYPWGEEYPDDTFANFYYGRDCHPQPVDSHDKGLSPYGIANMSGNVGEHVQDWYNETFDMAVIEGGKLPPLASESYPVRYNKPLKIVKGGYWSRRVDTNTISYRHLHWPRGVNNRYGVRFSLDMAEVLRLESLKAQDN